MASDSDRPKAEPVDTSVIQTQTQTSLATTRKGSKWREQADAIVIIAGVFAITVGCIATWDCIVESHNRNSSGADSLLGYYKGSRLRYSVLHEMDQISPLILFGAATAAGWIAVCRATFRMTSLEATPLLLHAGVRSSDLSNIFELKWPAFPWTRWRIKLWKSTVFTIMNCLLYVGASLSYRAAFSTRTLVIERPLESNRALVPMLSCGDGVLNSYSRLIDERRIPSTAYGRGKLMEEGMFSLPPSKWQDEFGWHNYQFEYDEDEFLSKAEISGSFLLAITQRVGASAAQIKLPDDSAGWKRLDLSTARHPKCGVLPVLCRDQAKEACVWFGLWVVNETANLETIEVDGYGSFLDRTPRVIPTECPIPLNASIYQEMMEFRSTGSAEQISFARSGMRRSRVIQFGTLLLALIENKPSYVLQPEGLVQNGFLDLRSSLCYRTGLRLGAKGYYGLATYEVSTDFWPMYQSIACACFILWGFLLVFAGLPYNGLLIKGDIDQYLSFGSDFSQVYGLGLDQIISEDQHTWKLTKNEQNSHQRLAFVRNF